MTSLVLVLLMLAQYFAICDGGTGDNGRSSLYVLGGIGFGAILLLCGYVHCKRCCADRRYWMGPQVA